LTALIRYQVVPLCTPGQTTRHELPLTVPLTVTFVETASRTTDRLVVVARARRLMPAQAAALVTGVVADVAAGSPAGSRAKATRSATTRRRARRCGLVDCVTV
jgi:hypothetical protein